LIYLGIIALDVIMSEIEEKAKDIKKAEPLLTSRSLCLYD
jgi:hypothetical protein